MFFRQIDSIYYIRELDKAEFADLTKAHAKRILMGSPASMMQDIRKTYKTDYNIPIYLGLFCRTAFVGWTYGYGYSSTAFYIESVAIARSHRGKGVHPHLLQGMMDCIFAQGFQTIKNTHHSNLSSLIAKKLRLGFVITGYQLDDQHGAVVQMEYHLKKKRRDILKFRAGSQRPNKEIAKILKLK